MDLALPDRPAWTEVVGVLLACLVLFAVIAKLDRAAADRAIARAHAAQVHRVAAKPAHVADSAPAARTGIGVALPGGGIAEPVQRGAFQPPPDGVTR